MLLNIVLKCATLPREGPFSMYAGRSLCDGLTNTCYMPAAILAFSCCLSGSNIVVGRISGKVPTICYISMA